MNIILLSGGSGKRLWPLSNEVRSKQFLKIFKTVDGNNESMLQRMCHRIYSVDEKANIVITTSEKQETLVHEQLGDLFDVSIEPCRRNTFPAIVLATAYLHDVKKVDKKEALIVCPVDSSVGDDYYSVLKKMYEHVKKDEANLVLMGIEPTYPSEKYGYIIPKSKDNVSRVEMFKEKPDKRMAEKYIEEGALWNGGIFAFQIEYILDIAEKQWGISNYRDILEKYNTFNSVSFDYAVVEKEPKIDVIRYNGKWKDLGTWNTLTEEMSENVAGNAIAVDCNKTHIINELHIPLFTMGVSDLAIVATPDGILVTDKKCSDKIGDYVVEQRPMYEKRIWGEYKVIDYRSEEDGNNYLTKQLIITPGQHISYQCHSNRAEMWTITEGEGKLIIDGEVKQVQRGDFIHIAPKVKHAILACTKLHIIEVQVGDYLSEEDIQRFELDWSRIQ